jgi:glycosyltransferase involved in cell wall biosynthesis
MKKNLQGLTNSVNIALLVYDLSILGGVERVSVQLAEALSQFYHVHVITLMQKNDKIPYAINEHIEVTNLNVSGQRLRQQMMQAKKPLRKVLREKQIKVVLLEGNYAAFVSIPAMLFYKTRIIYCDHGALMSQWNQLDIRLIRWLNMVCADSVVVLTKQSKKDYIQKLHCRRKKVQCIYNWIDDALLDEEHSYDSASTCIVSVGRFGKEKGYDLMVEVAKKIMPRYPTWQWKIYGDGETFQDISNKIKEAHLEEQVQLMGTCNGLDEVYMHAAALVLPSYREGLPLVLLEALAYKVPAVSFDILTGPRDIITDQVNGYLIKPYDTDKMAEQLGIMIENLSLREELSAHCHDTLERFNKQQVLHQWRSLIHKLMYAGRK